MATRDPHTPASPSRATERRRRAPSVWALLGALALLLLIYLFQRGILPPRMPGLEDASAAVGPVLQRGDGALQVFFTTPTLIYPDLPQRRTPPPYEQALIADLDAATATIDLATFEYNLESIAEALVRAQQRGVNVRLALDRERLIEPEIAAWAGEIEAAQIPIAWERSSAFLHSKFVIIDRRVVWTGSWNITNNGTYRNNNNLLRITIPAIVANYAAEFEQMFGEAFGTAKQSLAPFPTTLAEPARIETYFSPQDTVEPHILERLRAARRSIVFMAFSYTSDAVSAAMLERHAQGVAVRGVFERRNAGGIGAEFDTLRAGGVDVLEDGNCYTMHHKVIVIDGRTVITGSYNFTNRAENVNDENLLIIDDRELARLYLAEFERVYRQADEPTRCQ